MHSGKSTASAERRIIPFTLNLTLRQSGPSKGANAVLAASSKSSGPTSDEHALDHLEGRSTSTDRATDSVDVVRMSAFNSSAQEREL